MTNPASLERVQYMLNALESIKAADPNNPHSKMANEGHRLATDEKGKDTVAKELKTILANLATMVFIPGKIGREDVSKILEKLEQAASAHGIDVDELVPRRNYQMYADALRSGKVLQ